MLSLADARDRARDAILAAKRGADPAGEKQLAKRAARAGDGSDRDLFQNIVADFLKRHASKNRSATETERLFNREVFPAWSGRRIQEITKRDVIELLDRLPTVGEAQQQIGCSPQVRKLFNWTLERDILTASPCAGVKPPAVEVSRDRILSDDEIRWLWQACEAVPYPFGPLVKLLLVTAQRESEVGGASYSEMALSETAPSWTIPKRRAKNGREQFVPLSGLAVEIIGGLKRVAGKAGYLFTTVGVRPVTGFSNAKKIIDREMLRIARVETGVADLEIPRWTYHDLRRTAATGMQRLGMPIEVVEAVLNHKSGAVRGVAAIYGRHDFKQEKAKALEAWARFLESLIGRGDAGNVVTLARAS